MEKGKIICDTDVMIDYWDKSNPRHSTTKSILEKSVELDNVALSAVTKMELMVGFVLGQHCAFFYRLYKNE